MRTYLAKHDLAASGLSEEYLKIVEEAGLKGASFPCERVVVQESIRLKCQIPFCEHYGQSRVCPPNLPDLSIFRQVLADYEWAFLLKLEVPLAEIKGHEPELALDDFIWRSESWAMGKGCYWAFGLVGGACYRCNNCSTAGKCPHPYRPRPSPEGMGIDVSYLAREVGLDLSWPPQGQAGYFGLFFL